MEGDGLRLRNHLFVNKISREQAALDLDYSPSGLSRKFNESRFSDKLRQKILEVYGLDLSDTRYSKRVLEYAEAVKIAHDLSLSGNLSKEELREMLDQLKKDILSR